MNRLLCGNMLICSPNTISSSKCLLLSSRVTLMGIYCLLEVIFHWLTIKVLILALAYMSTLSFEEIFSDLKCKTQCPHFWEHLRWPNDKQSRLANIHERVRVSVDAPFIRPCAVYKGWLVCLLGFKAYQPL